MNIFKRISNLEFDPEEFIIIGSGIMEAKGIRESNDLDIVVSKNLFNKCRTNPKWELRPWTKENIDGNDWLKSEQVELMLCINHKGEELFLENLKESGEKINSIWFINLNQLIEFKKMYGRTKDFEDIKLIEDFLKFNS